MNNNFDNNLLKITPVMRNAVKEAMTLIHSLHGNCEAEVKENKYKAEGKTDYVTLADKEAQEVYLKAIKENFKGFGVIAEEDDLKISCEIEHCNIYFTVDPLDGT